jgi:hypothetical protein
MSPVCTSVIPDQFRPATAGTSSCVLNSWYTPPADTAGEPFIAGSLQGPRRYRRCCAERDRRTAHQATHDRRDERAEADSGTRRRRMSPRRPVAAVGRATRQPC